MSFLLCDRKKPRYCLPGLFEGSAYGICSTCPTVNFAEADMPFAEAMAFGSTSPKAQAMEYTVSSPEATV